MANPINVDKILLPGLRSALFEATEAATTIAELETGLQQFQATLAHLKAILGSPEDKIRLGLSQQKGGTS